MSYVVTFIRKDGQTQKRVYAEAPKPSRLAQFAASRCTHAIRYYPSKKHWRVFDLTQLRLVTVGGYRVISNPKHVASIDDEDAAITYAILMQGRKDT